MDQIKAMQIFRAVAAVQELRASGRTARPAAPHRHQRGAGVEQQLGVRLLQRTTRKVSLTMEGASISSAACACSTSWTT
jgi:LysR family transcriptional regulator for bpeEF and oprC